MRFCKSRRWRGRKGRNARYQPRRTHSKAQLARSLGFDEVIDLSVEKLSDGVRRITEGYGADLVIDALGREILSEALGTLSIGGNLTTLGYAAGRKATIDVTDLIWKRASMKSFSLFLQPAEIWTAAWRSFFNYFNPVRSSPSWQRRSRWLSRQMLCGTSLRAAPLAGSFSQSDSLL
jgi:NADPH:quinone reductase-like Zn-dependent oxidoreductase